MAEHHEDIYPLVLLQSLKLDFVSFISKQHFISKVVRLIKRVEN